ncbi:MAG TPA: hypothetical protein VKW06_07885 [Candidatus Angelobacter sp.]|nr:hypothetical protein [Candidatus Angelobacter sp.]
MAKQKSNLQIFAEHHALDPLTGKPKAGVSPAPEGCKCSACAAAVKDDGAVIVTEE